MKREKLTLNWRGKTARLPDIVFDDYIDPACIAVLEEQTKPKKPVAAPPLPVRTVEQQHRENVLLLLDRWADWVRSGEPIAEGAPRQCLGAPDARIHSFEDMEIEVNKRLVREVHTAIWELCVIEREAVMMHFGLNTRGVWRTNFAANFDQAVWSLFQILRQRVSC